MEHPPADALERAIDHIAAAPPDEGTLEMIVRRPDVGDREQLELATIAPHLGVAGDNWSVKWTPSTPDGTPHPDKQVTVMGARVIDALTAGDRSRWPLAGDQLYVDLDLSPENVPPGTRLGIGAVVLEVTDAPHRGCVKFAERFGVDGIRFVNSGVGATRRYRGINTRVVTGGRVTVGDRVRKLVGVDSPRPARGEPASADERRERPDV